MKVKDVFLLSCPSLNVGCGGILEYIYIYIYKHERGLGLDFGRGIFFFNKILDVVFKIL